MAIDRKYGRVSIPGIPDDEPVFILRAQDRVTTPTIVIYHELCGAIGAHEEHLTGIRAAGQAIVDWQEDHGSKVPDTAEKAVTSQAASHDYGIAPGGSSFTDGLHLGDDEIDGEAIFYCVHVYEGGTDVSVEHPGDVSMTPDLADALALRLQAAAAVARRNAAAPYLSGPGGRRLRDPDTVIAVREGFPTGQCLVTPPGAGWGCCLLAGHDGPHGMYHPAYLAETGVEQVYADAPTPRAIREDDDA